MMGEVGGWGSLTVAWFLSGLVRGYFTLSWGKLRWMRAPGAGKYSGISSFGRVAGEEGPRYASWSKSCAESMREGGSRCNFL